MKLQGKVALVTGGSRGIGRAIAVALAEEGCDVAVNYAGHHDAAEETCEMIRKLGRRALRYQANIANDDENHKMIGAIRNDLGVIQVLVNNAGITRDKSFAKMTHEMWSEVLDVDLTGPAMVTHEVLVRCMLESGWGRVVFITSIVGQVGAFGQANYAVAKGGLIALTKTLARETARKGITVNAVAPGYITTDMTSVVPESVIKQVCEQTPVGRLGQPEEVAEAVRFLVSPMSSYVTGEVINVNGGMFMG